MQISERLSTQIEKITLNRISTENLVTPSPTLAVRKYVKLSRKGNASAKEIAEAVSYDPMMTAKIVCRAGGSQESLEASIQKVGTPKVLALLVSASSSTLATSGNIEIQQTAENLWRHSFAVASLAKDITTLLGVETGELCFMLGLIHDLGRLTVATLLLEAEKAITASKHQAWVNADIWGDVVRSCYQSVEKALASSWPLPQPLKTLYLEGHEYDISDRDCAINIVRFANAIVEQEEFSDGFTTQEESSALVMVGKSLLNLDDEMMKPLTQNLRARIDENF